MASLTQQKCSRLSPSSFLALFTRTIVSSPSSDVQFASRLQGSREAEPRDIISSEHSSATAVSSCSDSFCCLWVTAYKVAHSDNLDIFGNMVFEWHVVCYHRQSWTGDFVLFQWLYCQPGPCTESHYEDLNPKDIPWKSSVTVLHSRTGVTSRILSEKVKIICVTLRKVLRAVSEVKLKWTCNFLHAQRGCHKTDVTRKVFRQPIHWDMFPKE